jgi:hypothetical protein
MVGSSLRIYELTTYCVIVDILTNIVVFPLWTFCTEHD